MGPVADESSAAQCPYNRRAGALGAATCDRLLVLVIARESENLVELLDRVPREVLDDECVDLLVLIDASSDPGTELAGSWARVNDPRRVIVLRNPVNQGWGGNQKLGFKFAVDGGYNLVILLSGIDADASELLPQIIDKWRETHADVILTSAAKGHVGHHLSWRQRMLGGLQRRLAGRDLSRSEGGCRAYSTAFLRRVPFELNTNEAHFDTEIVLQALHVAARIIELECQRDVPPEAPKFSRIAKTSAATLQWKLHQMGMVCSLKYRGPGHLRYSDKTFMAYSSHQIAMNEVARLSPSRVLDIGCGPGYVAEHVASTGAQITGIDLHPPVWSGMHRFVPFNLESGPLPVDAWDYELVLLLDVIEHLSEPEQFLLNLRNPDTFRPLTPGTMPAAPTLILSTPNVAFAAVRLNLLLGRFTYADRGILDITHKRLFTRRTLLRALEDCGYDVEKVHAAGVPFAAVVGGRLGRFLGGITGWMAKIWPTMFAFQFVVRCRPRPGVRQLLASAQRHHVPDERHIRVLQGQARVVEPASSAPADPPP